MQFNDDKICEPLKTRSFHFCPLNVNGLVSKTDKLRDITNNIQPSILGITEPKLDSTITNAEANINGYSITRMTKTKMVEVLQVTSEAICVLIPRIFF